jgi:chloramphenicol O-acetyltransferase type A
MRQIDLSTWPRRKHFEFFMGFDHPHFNLCADVDLTLFNPALRQRGISFTVGLVYVLTRAGNAIPEFRQRIRAGGVVEHDVVHLSTTVLRDDELFGFCTFEYSEDLSEFAPRATALLAEAKAHPILENEPGRDDLFFTSAIPWVAFTSFSHPMHLHPPDSIPRFAWGKFTQDGKRIKMPLSVQGHHALMDALHMARFYERVQDLLSHPEGFLTAQTTKVVVCSRTRI